MTPLPFSMVTSILHASTALSFNNMHKWAIHMLESMWSQDIDYITEDHIPHTTETVNLMWECDILLTCWHTYYELLCMSGFSQDFDDAPSGRRAMEAKQKSPGAGVGVEVHCCRCEDC